MRAQSLHSALAVTANTLLSSAHTLSVLTWITLVSWVDFGNSYLSTRGPDSQNHGRTRIG